MKQLLVLTVLSLFMLESNLYAQEEEKVSFLKKLDLVIGGTIYMNSSNQTVLSDYVNNDINSDVNSTTNGQYETQGNGRDFQFYTGLNIGKFLLLGISYRDALSVSDWTIDYGSPGSPFIYTYSRDTKLRSSGVFARYYIPFSEKINFALQPFISDNDIRSIYTNGFNQAANQSFTQYEQNFNFFRAGLSTQICFKLSKRFNFLANFGRVSYMKGEATKTTKSFSEGIQQGVTLFSKNDIDDFEANFNYSSLSIGFEIVL